MNTRTPCLLYITLIIPAISYAVLTESAKNMIFKVFPNTTARITTRAMATVSLEQRNAYKQRLDQLKEDLAETKRRQSEFSLACTKWEPEKARVIEKIKQEMYICMQHVLQREIFDIEMLLKPQDLSENSRYQWMDPKGIR